MTKQMRRRHGGASAFANERMGLMRLYDLDTDNRLAGGGKEYAVGEQDRVVRALLIAIATLEDLVQLMPESAMALSTLEDIAYELGEMRPDDRQAFIEALKRIAAADTARADWVLGLPRKLGLVDLPYS